MPVDGPGVEALARQRLLELADVGPVVPRREVAVHRDHAREGEDRPPVHGHDDAPFLSLAPLTGACVTMSLLVCFVAAPLTPEVASTTGWGAP